MIDIEHLVEICGDKNKHLTVFYNRNVVSSQYQLVRREQSPSRIY